MKSSARSSTYQREPKQESLFQSLLLDHHQNDDFRSIDLFPNLHHPFQGGVSSQFQGFLEDGDPDFFDSNYQPLQPSGGVFESIDSGILKDNGSDQISRGVSQYSRDLEDSSHSSKHFFIQQLNEMSTSYIPERSYIAKNKENGRGANLPENQLVRSPHSQIKSVARFILSLEQIVSTIIPKNKHKKFLSIIGILVILRAIQGNQKQYLRSEIKKELELLELEDSSQFGREQFLLKKILDSLQNTDLQDQEEIKLLLKSMQKKIQVNYEKFKQQEQILKRFIR